LPLAAAPDLLGFGFSDKPGSAPYSADLYVELITDFIREVTDYPVNVIASSLGAAFAGRREKTEGSLEPGKLADFILLDRDLFKIEPSEIDKTEVLITVVGGKIVYQSPNWKDSPLAEKTAKKK